MHQYIFWPSLFQEAKKYLLDTPTPEALEGHSTHVFLFSKASGNIAYYISSTHGMLYDLHN